MTSIGSGVRRKTQKDGNESGSWDEDNRLKDSKVISETGVLCDTRNDPKVNEPRAMRKVAVNETNGHRTNAT